MQLKTSILAIFILIIAPELLNADQKSENEADLEEAKNVAQFIAKIQAWKQTDMRCLTTFVASLHSLQIQQPISFFLGKARRKLELDEAFNNISNSEFDLRNVSGNVSRRQFDLFDPGFSGLDIYDTEEEAQLANAIDAVQNYRSQLVELAMTYANHLQHLHFHNAIQQKQLVNPFSEVTPPNNDLRPEQPANQSSNSEQSGYPQQQLTREQLLQMQYQNKIGQMTPQELYLKQQLQQKMQQQQQQFLQYAQRAPIQQAPMKQSQHLDPNQILLLQQLLAKQKAQQATSG